MARKNASGEPEDEFPAPFIEPESTPIAPIETIDIDEAIEQVANPEAAANGKRFFFGHVGVLKFTDKTEYHVSRHHALITDPKLIANLIEASKDENLRIFLQD